MLQVTVQKTGVKAVTCPGGIYDFCWEATMLQLLLTLPANGPILSQLDHYCGNDFSQRVQRVIHVRRAGNGQRLLLVGQENIDVGQHVGQTVGPLLGGVPIGIH